MASMFCTLEEAARILDVDVDLLKRYCSDGHLQCYRDRGKQLIKRDSLDVLSALEEVVCYRDRNKQQTTDGSLNASQALGEVDDKNSPQRIWLKLFWDQHKLPIAFCLGCLTSSGIFIIMHMIIR